MKLVTNMGGVWQLTNRQYKNLIEHLASGGHNNDLDSYGGKFLGFRELDVTDVTPDLRDQCRMSVPGYPEHTEYMRVKKQHGL